jgi:hypothetical protein
LFATLARGFISVAVKELTGSVFQMCGKRKLCRRPPLPPKEQKSAQGIENTGDEFALPCVTVCAKIKEKERLNAEVSENAESA